MALDWWKNYYNDWVKSKLPVLNNITPTQEVKTKSGRERVKALIDEFENSKLSIKSLIQRIFYYCIFTDIVTKSF